jgi:hypothetical protein
MKVTHEEKAAEYLAITERWGFSSEILRRIGAFVILWGLFETKLELAVWSLRDENVAGRRPSTDGAPMRALINALGEGSEKLDGPVRDVLKTAATTASDLMEYRHSLIHGHMMPSDEMPSFLRNPQWHGEIRKRQGGEAFVTENLLDMAIDSAGTLCQLVLATPTACNNPTHVKQLLALGPDVSRAKSQANELRHLAVLIAHEKY